MPIVLWNKNRLPMWNNFRIWILAGTKTACMVACYRVEIGKLFLTSTVSLRKTASEKKAIGWHYFVQSLLIHLPLTCLFQGPKFNLCNIGTLYETAIIIECFFSKLWKINTISMHQYSIAHIVESSCTLPVSPFSAEFTNGTPGLRTQQCTKKNLIQISIVYIVY